MVIAIYGARNSPFSSSGEYRARILNLEFGPRLKIPQGKKTGKKISQTNWRFSFGFKDSLWSCQKAKIWKGKNWISYMVHFFEGWRQQERRVGTHDLSPIFQSVSHAYQLCNKVSQLSEEPAWNENLAKKKIVAASTHGKRRGVLYSSKSL